RGKASAPHPRLRRYDLLRACRSNKARRNRAMPIARPPVRSSKLRTSQALLWLRFLHASAHAAPVGAMALASAAAADTDTGVKRRLAELHSETSGTHRHQLIATQHRPVA